MTEAATTPTTPPTPTTAASTTVTPLPPPRPDSAEDKTPGGEEKEGDKQEEKPECGFCVFMKAGGCAEAFEAWSRCVDAARESEKRSDGGGEGDDGNKASSSSASDDPSVPDFASRCRDATMALQRCMEEHRDYYKDFLADAEEAVAAREEKGGEGGGGEEKETKK